MGALPPGTFGSKSLKEEVWRGLVEVWITAGGDVRVREWGCGGAEFVKRVGFCLQVPRGARNDKQKSGT